MRSTWGFNKDSRLLFHLKSFRWNIHLALQNTVWLHNFVIFFANQQCSSCYHQQTYTYLNMCTVNFYRRCKQVDVWYACVTIHTAKLVEVDQQLTKLAAMYLVASYFDKNISTCPVYTRMAHIILFCNFGKPDRKANVNLTIVYWHQLQSSYDYSYLDRKYSTMYI